MTQNKQRTNALYRHREGVWQEFTSIITCTLYFDGQANIDHFEGTLPDGEVRKGLYTQRTEDGSLTIACPSSKKEISLKPIAYR